MRRAQYRETMRYYHAMTPCFIHTFFAGVMIKVEKGGTVVTMQKCESCWADLELQQIMYGNIYWIMLRNLKKMILLRGDVSPLPLPKGKLHGDRN